MVWNKKNLENTFIISTITVFAGQIYINPFLEWFRFSFAVLALTFLMLYYKKTSILLVSTITGIGMFIFRAFVHFITYQDMTFTDTLWNYFPVITFYVVFGVLFKVLNVREKVHNPTGFIIALWLCDSIGNMSEAIVRSSVLFQPFNRVILFIIFIGQIRAVITYLIYNAVRYYKQRYERQQHENKVKELLLFIAKLKTELFFLKKSRLDIEDTMEKSYELYEKIKDDRLKSSALMVAKNIHEIKKDYLRVITGMENTLTSDNEKVVMTLNEICSIIEVNTQKFIDMNKKEVDLMFQVEDNFCIKDYYPLISCLNNLIINGIEAIDKSGSIKIKEWKKDDRYIFEVIDNGSGIEEDNLELIFEPGFSTKYDRITGNFSTGIGLSHTKNIIEHYYKGTIKVINNRGGGTTFKIILPSHSIEVRRGSYE